MANIMINRVCNLKCPYCFANEFVNQKECVVHESNMTFENFKKAVDFICRTPGERVGIIGGEPLLHPDINKMIKDSIDKNEIRDVIVFTNGIHLDNIINELGNVKIHVLVNYNPPTDTGKKANDKILSNLDEAINKRFLKDKITLGINMYKPGFEYEYILTALRKFNYHNVRTSICVPNTSEKKNQNSIEYFKKMKDSVMEFFGECLKLGVVPNFDCNPLPKCLWTEEDWDLFDKFEKLDRNCNLTRSCKCSPVLDILPNLQVSRCFGCSEAKTNLFDFKNCEDIRRFFSHEIDSVMETVPTTDKCKQCYDFVCSKCSGGCLAFKWDKAKERQRVIDEHDAVVGVLKKI